jgi:hypothetical protein
VVKVIIPNSHDEAISWRYTTTAPAGDTWMNPNFDDSAWKEGPAGFGTPQTPNTVVRTTWNTADIWIRRTVELPANLTLTNPTLMIHHDEDAEVYINGTLAAQVAQYNNDYEPVKLDTTAARLLKAGTNTIAVHCHQTVGGQFIDVGLVDVMPGEK